MNEIKEKHISVDLIKLIEKKYLKENALLTDTNQNLRVGDIIRLGYLIPEGGKDRTQYYEGLIIAINNRGLGKSFTLRGINYFN